MYRFLTPADKDLILAFAYERERENMFVIGAFNKVQDSFLLENVYLGYFEGEKLTGLAVHFSRFGSLVINAQDPAVINECVDRIVQMKNRPIEHVPSFKRYTLPTVEALRRHGMEPITAKDETVFLLTKEDFVDHPSTEITMATADDVDEILRLDYAASGKDENKEPTDRERRQVIAEDFFVCRVNGRIISQANIHGYSKHYAQIGCVGTHPDFRGQGYAKRTVGALCKHWIERGKQMILFCHNDNAPALRVYETLGFKPFDEFVIAEY